MVVDPRHDHSLRIPRPDLSAKLGMPNACNNCHAKQTAQWAADAIAKWTGKHADELPELRRGAARGLDRRARARAARCSALIDDKAQPAIVRASAIDRLGRWLDAGDASTPSSRALNDPDPLVRLAAVEALANAEPATRAALSAAHARPIRCARCASRRRARSPAPPSAGSPPRDRAAFAKALAEYVAAQTYNADRPEGAIEPRQSLRDARRCRAAQSPSTARRSRSIRPSSPAYVEPRRPLPRARRRRRRRGDAARGPRAQPEGRGAASRARPRAGAPEADAPKPAGTRARRRGSRPTTRASPTSTPWRSHDAGQRKDALQVLRGGAQAHPYDRDVLSGLAHYSLRGRQPRRGAAATSSSCASSIPREPGLRAARRADRRATRPLTRLGAPSLAKSRDCPIGEHQCGPKRYLLPPCAGSRARPGTSFGS